MTNESIALSILGAAVPPLLGLLVWFLHRMVESNDKAHNSFSNEIKALRNEINDLENQLIRINVIDSKDIDRVKRDISKHKSSIEQIGTAVDKIKEKVEKKTEPAPAINYGHFEEGPGKIIQVGGEVDKAKAFKVEVINRLDRVEGTIKTHEAAIGRVASLEKENRHKIEKIIPPLKEVRASVADKIKEHREKTKK